MKDTFADAKCIRVGSRIAAEMTLHVSHAIQRQLAAGNMHEKHVTTFSALL